jgi:hypothetical protein
LSGRMMGMGRMTMRMSVARVSLMVGRKASVSMMGLRTSRDDSDDNVPRIDPPCGLGLAERSHNVWVPGGLQRNAIRKGYGDSPEICCDDDDKGGIAGSPRPLEGENAEVEQADGDLGEC